MSHPKERGVRRGSVYRYGVGARARRGRRPLGAGPTVGRGARAGAVLLILLAATAPAQPAGPTRVVAAAVRPAPPDAPTTAPARPDTPTAVPARPDTPTIAPAQQPPGLSWNALLRAGLPGFLASLGSGTVLAVSAWGVKKVVARRGEP